MQKLSFIIVFLLSLLCQGVHADSSDCPLTGLKNATVAIDIKNVDKRIHIDTDALKSRIESKLSDSGINVKSGSTVLTVYVSTLDLSNDKICAFDIEVGLSESVVLARTKLPAVSVITWMNVTTGVGLYTQLGSDIPDCAAGVVDDFLKEFKKDNPPLSPTIPTLSQ
jgi:hypothetical protein